MKLAQVTVLATLLATAAVSVQAAEIRLGDAELDTVSAGIRMPHSPLLQQLPAILDAYGYGDAFRSLNVGPVMGQLGRLSSLFLGRGMPIGGMPIGNMAVIN